MAIVAGWMFLSERYEWTLAVLVLYLGLLDGFVKLSSGSQFATLGRDVLLYAIVAGAIARLLLRRQHVVLPPLSGWVLAFVLVVLVSVLHPGSYPMSHAIPSVRPHLEFVPLFFLGYFVMRTKARLRGFLVLLLICGAANGVVNAIQFNMDAEQLAAWGPGYNRLVNGEGALAGRTFYTGSGDRVRPFGLGGDAGGGGNIAVLAVPGAIALIGLARRRRAIAAIALMLAVGVVTAVVTSQGRGVVIAGVVMTLAYVVLAVSGRRVVPTITAIAVVGVVVLLVIDSVGTSGGSDAFSRYESIAPSKVFSTTGEDRGSALSIVPDYIRDFPLGYGLGTGGPATGFGGAASRARLSAESEFAFLVLEVGVLGLLIVVGFTLRLLMLALTRVRRIPDGETRTLVAAILAPVFGIAALYVTGPATAGAPLAPYLWFAAGMTSYWLVKCAPSLQHRRPWSSSG
jgi:hypothetical protein